MAVPNKHEVTKDLGEFLEFARSIVDIGSMLQDIVFL